MSEQNKKRAGGIRYQITLSEKDKEIYDRAVEIIADRYNLTSPRRGWCVARALSEWISNIENEEK